MQAEQAAKALEDAWRHWRRRHGLPRESMLPVSSYVGYSPAEPWGQPRVVFGLAADDAAALTLLLEGHDCVGPVHAKVASHPGARPGDRLAALPVPRQDVPGEVASRRRPDRLRPPRRPDPLDPAQAVEFTDPHVSRRPLKSAGADGEHEVAGRSPAGLADEHDGPVFRQLAGTRAPDLIMTGTQATAPGPGALGGAAPGRGAPGEVASGPGAPSGAASGGAAPGPAASGPAPLAQAGKSRARPASNRRAGSPFPASRPCPRSGPRMARWRHLTLRARPVRSRPGR